MEGGVTFFVDLLFFLRCFAGLSWGALWAYCLQYTRKGQWLAEERTWITVVVGVGVDLLIAVPASWATVVCVVACSSVGIIVRSLLNERQRASTLGRNKMLWVLEDTDTLTQEAGEVLARLIEDLDNGALVVKARDALLKVQKANLLLRGAQQGEYLG